MMTLYLEAPFAAFRTFTAGSFRPTAPFVTPSAAYGLLLNVAGIEMRHDDGQSPMTLIAEKLPRFRLALGALELPIPQTVFQQLHNYPVGNTGKEHAPHTKGSKYNITPVRRAFLDGIRGYICLDGDPGLESRIHLGLRGEGHRTYGLPFLGDNSCLIDRLEPVERNEPARWYVPARETAATMRDEGAARLTVRIDRADMSRTVSELRIPAAAPSAEVPDAAWLDVGY